MSNLVKKIQKNVESDKALKRFTLYGTTAGSAIVSVGKLCGMKEAEMIKEFAILSKDEEFFKCKNIREVCDFLINRFKMPEEYKQNLILVYDEENKYTPIITIELDGFMLPLDTDGTLTGILAQCGEKESIKIEDIYE